MQIRGHEQIIANTITSAEVDSSIIVANGANAYTADQSMGGNKLTNVGTPTTGTDVANKNYVDIVAQGLVQKPTARVATTAALPANTYNNGTAGVGATLTGNSNGALSAQDGITLVANDIIVVKNEAATANNGLYTLTQVGDGSHPYILTRHVDMDQSTEFSGAFIPVDNEGTANANTLWLAGYSASFTVGTTGVTFIQLNSAASLTSGNGISISSNIISADLGNGLAFSGTHIVVSPDATGGANLAQAINVSANGVAVKIDNATIGANGSNQLYVPNGGIGTAQLANASITNAKLAAQATGTGLKGGNGSDLALQLSVRETPTGSVNGSNTVFTLAHTPVSGLEEVYLNGLLQDAGSLNDYTISAGTITFNSAPISGDKVRVTYPY